MSQTIDQRVVEMRFDNKQFESAIADTQKTVKSFNKNLEKEFGESSKDLDKLGDAAEEVRIKFSFWETLKFTALHSVLNDLISKVKTFVNASTIDQVAAGWQKYADKTEAVQTIMNATGKSIEDVEAQLDKLNWFADETSYSFIDMTSNVGKFTAAGVELETAVTAMQGISTWAALSGANTEQASRAMYNLSQAMGMGAVRVQDWMSIENANMATKEFKEMAIQAATNLKVWNEELGEFEDKSTLKIDNDGIIYAPDTKAGVDVTAENFRSTLSEGWFTSDVLLKVLDMYGKATDVLSEMQALSGVDTTSELLNVVEAYNKAEDALEKEKIFEEFIRAQDLEDDAAAVEELRKQFELLATDEYELALKAFRAAQEAKTFKEAINATKDAVSTKWMNVFQDIFGSYEQAKKLWTDVSNILWDIFAGPIDNLHESTKKWSKDGGLEDVHAIITGILESISAVWQAIRDTINLITYGTTEIEDKVSETGEVIEGIATKKAKRLKAITGAIRSVVEGIQKFVTSEPFQNALLGIGKVVQALAGVFKSVWGIIKTIFNSIKDTVKNFIGILDVKRTLKAIYTGKEYKKITFISVLDWIREKLDSFAQWLSSSGVISFISRVVGKFVKFVLELPGKLNRGFQKLTGSTIGEAFKKLFDKIKQLFVWIGEGIKKLAGVETYAELFDKIKEKLIKVFTSIGNFFKSIGSKVLQWAKADSYKALWEKIKNKFVDFFTFIKGLFSKKKEESLISTASTTSKAIESANKTNVFAKIGEGFRKFFQSIAKAFTSEGAKNIYTTIVNVLKNIVKAIVNFVKNIDWSSILTAAITFRSITKSIARLKLASAVKSMANGIEDFGLAALKFGTAVVNASKAMKRQATASLLRAFGFMLLAFAVAIGVIALAIYKLGKLEPESLKQGAIVVGAILAAVFVLIVIVVSAMKVLAKTGGPQKLAALQRTMAKSLTSIAALLVAVAILVNRLAKVIIKLAKVENPESLKNATYIVLALMAVTILLIVVLLSLMQDEKKGLLKNGGESSTLSKNAAKAIYNAAVLLLAVSLVVKILANSIIKIAKAGRGNNLTNAVIIVFALIAAVFAITVVALSLVKDSKNGVLKDGGNTKSLSANAAKAILSVAVLLVALGAVVGLLVDSIVRISKVKPDRLGSAVAVLAVLVGIVLLSVAVIATLLKSEAIKDGKLNKNSSANAGALLALAVVFVALGVLINAMAIALSIMSVLNPKRMLVGIVAIVAVIGVLALLVLAVKKVPATTLLGLSVTLIALGAAMVLMATAFLIMVPVFAALSKYNFGQLATVAGGIFLVMAAFAAGGLLLTVALPGLLGFAAFVGILAISVALISVSVVALGAGLTVLGAAIVAFSTLIVTSSEVIKESVEVMVDVMVIAAKAFLSGIIDIIISLVTKIGELLLALIITVCDTIIQGAPKIFEAVGVILIGILDLIIKLVPKIVETIVTIIKALADHGYEIATYLIQFFISLIQAVADNMDPMIEAFANLFVNLFDSLANHIPRILESFGNFIFEIIDNTLGMILKGIFESLGNALSAFATAAEPFFNALKGIDPASLSAIAALGDMILKITAGAVVNAIMDFIGLTGNSNPLVLFGMQLAQFAPYLVAYADAVKGLDTDAVEASARAGAMMSALANSLPLQGGILQDIFGSRDLGVFGKQLEDFAVGFVHFYKVLQPIMPIDQDSVESVAIAGKTMAALYDNLPLTGGLLQSIFGEAMDLGEFGRQLKKFGEGFVGFYKTIIPIMPIDHGAVQSTMYAAQMMAKLYENLPLQDGLLQSIFGHTMDLGTFGRQLEDFAKGFVKFYKVISKENIDAQIVGVVTNAALALSGLYNNLPLQDGVFQSIFGKKMDLNGFGADLVLFAAGFNSFYETIRKDIKGDIVESVANAAKAMASLYEYLPKQNGVFQDIFGGGKVMLDDFGNQLKLFGSGFNVFYEEISQHEIDQGIVEAVTTAAQTMASLYRYLPKKNGFFQDVFGGGNVMLDDFGSQLKLFGEGFMDFYAVVSTEEIDASIIDSVSNAGKTMAGLYKALNDGISQSGWIQKIFGGQTINLDTFGDQLEKFGKGFKKFYNEIKGLNVKQTTVDSVANAGKTMVELYKSLNPSGGWWEKMVNWISGKSIDKTITGMTEVCISVAGALKTVSDEYGNSGISTESMDKFLAQATQLILLFQNITASNGVDSKKIKTNLTNCVTAITDTFRTSILSSSTGLPSSGTEAANQVVTAFYNALNFSKAGDRTAEQNAETLDRAATSLVDYFTTSLKVLFLNGLKEVGLWIAQGLASGVSSESSQQTVYNAGVTVATAGIRGVTNVTQTHSPSRVMMEIGQYMSEGLALGIADYSTQVEDAASDVGFDAISALNEAIKTSGDYLGNAVDGSLVLTPVLDLSEIQNGAAIISQMMSNTAGLSFGGTFDYANRTAASRQAADIYDPSVVSLDKLSGAIEDLLSNPQGITNNFTINSDADPKEIAEEVSRIIQTQVERRQAVWAR